MSRENLTLKERNEILQQAVFNQRKLIETLEKEVKEWKTCFNSSTALANSYKEESLGGTRAGKGECDYGGSIVAGHPCDDN